MKVFISLPMGGLSEEEIRESQIAALEEVKMLTNSNVEILDTYMDLGENATTYDYIGESIKLFSQADAIYFFGDWTAAKGCLVERVVAELYCRDKIIEENKEGI